MSNAASIFATMARSERHFCGWCLESGEGTLIFVGNRLVLSSHLECQETAKRLSLCFCLERAGDDKNCSVHGGEK